MSSKRHKESYSPEYRKKQKVSEKFSFLRYKRDVQSLLNRYNLITDWEQFWKFAAKFEMMRIAKPNEDIARKMVIRLNIDVGLLEKSVSTASFTLSRLKDLVLMIEAYLTFKQKNNFNKLQELRKSQKELPVAAYREIIVELLQTESVLIVAGDTGCGKSTQVPQYITKGLDWRVVCTQPRRLPCIALASRLKLETLSQHSQFVGYQIRFEKQRNNDTKILFMTEGLLLRQLAADPSLEGCDVVILDEVHERHLHGDLLLGLLRCLLLKRPNLKLILMSATINIELFHSYFRGEAKIVQVPGRLFPVELQYRPVSAQDVKSRSKVNCTPYLQILQIIETKFKGQKGDVLIFMSGVAEITCLVDAIMEFNKKDENWVVLPLHSQLSLAQQDKVFDYPPAGVRKCIVSTNIAETSLTIDGIRFVIDSGRVKEMSYDPVTRVQSLKEFWVSKSSAEQRKGRAGRTGPGTCFRIYSQEDFDGLDDFTTPEIKRVPLETVLLQVMAMGLPDVRKFPFLEPPNGEDMEYSIASLKQQDALSADEKITTLGQVLSTLPVDIPVGKMLVMGSVFKQAETALVLAAALSVPTAFTSFGARDFDCERERKTEESDIGDPITLVRLYRGWLEVKMRKEDSRRWCRKRGLEEQRFYELTKLRMQFKDILTDTKLLEEPEEAPVSSAERRIRSGEVKLLKQLKGKADKSSTRKELKLRQDDDQEEGSGELDLRDIEFRLRSDPGSLSQLLKDINVTHRQDLTIARLVFCSGLYPQFAIPDEFNAHKAEPVYHTKNKAFVFLHPTSQFAKDPDILRLSESEIICPPTGIKYVSRLPFSGRHQLLCYLSMLETTKVYLTNMIRMPALQTFLLFSKQIDTSFDFSKIVCDGWVLFEPLVPSRAETLMLQLGSLRTKLSLAIEQKLSRSLEARSELVRRLTVDLLEFLNSELVYGMKRLVPADLKYIYTHDLHGNINGNPFDVNFEPKINDLKGGLQLTDYLTFNCVITNEGYNPFDEEIFNCSSCGLEKEMNSLQRLEHRALCKVEGTIADDKPTKTDPNQIQFDCDVCKKVLFLTVIQVLKHKIMCKPT